MKNFLIFWRKCKELLRRYPIIAKVAVIDCTLLLSCAWFGFSSYTPLERRAEVSYSDFWNYYNWGQIKKITFYRMSRQIWGTLTTKRNDRYIIFKTGVPGQWSFQEPDKEENRFIALANSKTTSFPIAFQSSTPYFEDATDAFREVFFILFGLSCVAIFILVVFQSQDPLSKAGKMTRGTGVEVIAPEKRITFADVGGVDEVLEEVKIIVEFLKEPAKFSKLGGRLPRGYLFVGPPGTGKTLLAKAVAGEANRPFFSASGTDFVEVFVGVGPGRVRDLFKRARENKPCIIFIDEIDSVGRARAAGIQAGGSEEYDNTLQQLLVEMDGMNTAEGVVLIGATNRPERLDSALVRPGRFDKHIVVNRPDVNGRVTILKIHTRKIKLRDDVDLHKIAQIIPGFTGAEIENLANQAALIAARKGKEYVDMDDFNEVRDTVVMGEARHIFIADEDKKRIAYHELGHTIVAIFSSPTDPVEKVSIIPRGLSLGATFQMPKEDQVFATKQKLLAQLRVMLGGRASELEFLGDDVSNGARDDLNRATVLAKKMIGEWGMSEKFGPMVYTEDQGAFLQTNQTFFSCSEKTRSEIDEEIKKMIVNAQREAQEIIRARRKEIEAIIPILFEKETLTKEEIDEILKKI
ncbi:MAG: ATP-dependent zinc metalloprotease FtsH [Parcubacteria group bacterium]|nr:ATP-dependent zinc metalloprotease FtsH [Parcubacteria group bacterium]